MLREQYQKIRKQIGVARPRKFEEKNVLDKITHLFWENGFETTSLEDIINASGLNKGSLYSCFGNKEELFQLALENYSSKGPFYFLRDIESPLERLSVFFFQLIIEGSHQKKQRRGCFVFNSSLEFANRTSPLASRVSAIGKRNEYFFHALMEEARKKGELSKRVNLSTAAERAHATAFTIREISKFKSDKKFLLDLANSFFESIRAAKYFSKTIKRVQQ